MIGAGNYSLALRPNESFVGDPSCGVRSFDGEYGSLRRYHRYSTQGTAGKAECDTRRVPPEHLARPISQACTGSEKHFAHKHCGLCKSLEHRTCGWEERGAEKGAILAKMNMPASSEVGLVAATIGAARGNGKEEWDSDYGALFRTSRTQAEMTAYMKAPAGKTVEVADETILPVVGSGTVEVDLDQPGTTTKPVKMVSVAYEPGYSRNLLSTRKAMDQWGKPLVYCETKAALGFPGEESLVLKFCPRKGLFYAAGVRRTLSQEAALGLSARTPEAIILKATDQ